MNRTRRTAANAIAQAIAVLIQSVFGLFVTREIIAHIGSDYNGINSTATQVLTVLSLLEGGFTLATLVCLYKPYNENDIVRLNQYLSLSAKKYRRIGGLYLIVGIMISVAYAPFVKTEAGLITTVSIMILSAVSSSFSIFYLSKYRLVYQVSQSEYVLYIVQASVNVLMYISEIVIIRLTKSIVCSRLCVTTFQIISGLMIGAVARKRFRFVSFKESHEGVSVSGTGDVFVSRVSGLIYSSCTVLFISTFVGTALTSVYAVYNSVLGLIGNYINVCLTAPRNALGQLMHDGQADDERLRKVYDEYEYIAILAVALLYSITMALIIPFVKVYTFGIADINYIDIKLALLLVLVSVTQMIHIPSGTCIEISGRFKAVKKIQGMTAVLILILSILGARFAGLYGILTAKLLTNIVLASVEIIYARKVVLHSNALGFCRVGGINIIVGSVLAVVEMRMMYIIQIDIMGFIVGGIILCIINVVILGIVNIIFYRNIFLRIVRRITKLFK